MKLLTLLLFCVSLTGLFGCQKQANVDNETSEAHTASVQQQAESGESLVEARAGFQTVIIREDEPSGPVDIPPEDVFSLVKYMSSVGELSAFLSLDPGDGKKHPAIIWITGGDCNSIGDIWSPMSPSNDQSAKAFREQGMIMMFPSLRGGNDNPGKREGFYGEVDDVLAAAAHLSELEYVDQNQIYLGGHSTGGTLVMLVAESTDRFKATFAFGPVASPSQYGGEFFYADIENETEVQLRSPLYWFESVTTPLYVFEGMDRGNWDVVEGMQEYASFIKNPNLHFFGIPNHNHFSVLHPVTNLLAKQIKNGQLNITESTLQGL